MIEKKVKKVKVSSNFLFEVPKDELWKAEWKSLWCINQIREILDTYWDEDYKLYKIKETIKKWIEKD